MVNKIIVFFMILLSYISNVYGNEKINVYIDDAKVEQDTYYPAQGVFGIIVRKRQKS